MFETAARLIEALNLDVIETVDAGPREERREALPSQIVAGPLSPFISALTTPEGRVWRHQSIALKHLVSGNNVVVATGPTSGKSLVFQLYALHRILGSDEERVLVFYPLKALASDQYERWQCMAGQVGLARSAVARVDGDISPPDRENALEQARVVLMTPDVCQAWLMRSVGSGLVRRFLDRLGVLVLDEAHVYESVFGSNVAFLLRRMIAAKRRAARGNLRRPFQVIAATATIAAPADHLNALTGLEFAVVDESENGAPQQPLRIVHVDGAEYGVAGEAALRDVVKGIRQLPSRHRFIAFFDSRQGVERIVRDVDEPSVLPYRAGYEAEDRRNIEVALRSGALDGVIATSALELGIDIADMEVGVNLGVPESRKAFRQRIGRVGRSIPGVFFVIAGPNAFRRYGETFSDYYRGSVEPSYLYLGNRFIQFAHARCLNEEMEVLGADRIAPPSGVEWPQEFATIFGYARPGGGRPREFDFIAQLGSDAPHFNYPLRQVGEATLELKDGGHSLALRIGNIATNQAIREAYPGANYLHLGRPYKVLQWRLGAHERSIRLAAARSPVTTRPILRKVVTLSLAGDGIVNGRIKRSPNGLVAEAHLQVNESVEGYSIGNSIFMYRDLRAENANMSRKQRDFRTTGVVLRIDEPWFSGVAPQNRLRREQVASGLLGLISRDRSISPRDIDAAHSNIALLTESGPKRLTDAVVIYDSVYGGLRLTEGLYDDIGRYVAQLEKAAELAGDDALTPADVAENLKSWIETLAEGAGEPARPLDVPEGWFQVYKPGSIVSIMIHGSLVERELVEPRLVDAFGTGMKTLYYQYKKNGGTAFVPHDQVQPTGDAWAWALWNPVTSEYRELDDDNEGEPTT